MSSAEKGKAIHLKGLNGIRAIAAMGVVFSHVTESLQTFGLRNFSIWKEERLIRADYWVSLFFVLSGFLITYLLLIEKESRGINIKKFYLRRVLRIWPLYYLILGLTILVNVLTHVHFSAAGTLWYFFFAANVPFTIDTAIPNLRHYWSLGVEEQYYLFWPWMVKYLRHLKIIILTIIIGFIAGIVLCRYLTAEGYRSYLFRLFYVNRFHNMMLGSLGGILYYERSKWFIKLTTNRVIQIAAWLGILLICLNRFNFFSFLDYEFVSGIALVLIMGQITERNRIINLENRVFDFLGKISFGIYIIHPLIMVLVSAISTRLSIPYVIKFCLVYCAVPGLSIGLAYLSYQYFEKPFLRIKRRFEVVKTKPSSEGATAAHHDKVN